MYQIVVTYKSEVLGSGTFWSGPAEEIDQIANVPARLLAQRLVDNPAGPDKATCGMWTVTRVHKDDQ